VSAVVPAPSPRGLAGGASGDRQRSVPEDHRVEPLGGSRSCGIGRFRTGAHREAWTVASVVAARACSVAVVATVRLSSTSPPPIRGRASRRVVSTGQISCRGVSDSSPTEPSRRDAAARVAHARRPQDWATRRCSAACRPRLLEQRRADSVSTPSRRFVLPKAVLGQAGPQAWKLSSSASPLISRT
jgi:hypothetical protein